MPGGVEGLYEINLLHHVGVVAKRVCAAAAAETAHEGDDNTLSGPTGRGVKMISKVSYYLYQMKWNESGFRPPLCTYRLNWARRTSWGWWDDWDDTVLQTQDSKFEPWRSEAEHATSRSRRLPTILTFTRGWGRNIFVSFKPPRPGTEPRTLAWKAAVLTTTLGPPPIISTRCRHHLQQRGYMPLSKSQNNIVLKQPRAKNGSRFGERTFRVCYRFSIHLKKCSENYIKSK